MATVTKHLDGLPGAMTPGPHVPSPSQILWICTQKREREKKNENKTKKKKRNMELEAQAHYLNSWHQSSHSCGSTAGSGFAGYQNEASRFTPRCVAVAKRSRQWSTSCRDAPAATRSGRPMDQWRPPADQALLPSGRTRADSTIRRADWAGSWWSVNDTTKKKDVQE